MLLIIFFLLFNANANESFESWKIQYSKRAAKHGISRSFSQKILKGLQLDKTVLAKDKKQIILSKTTDYNVFMKNWLRENPSRIEKGKEVLKNNLELLKKVEKKYGVEKEIIISLWGVETFYGGITGSFDLVRSLATLAYASRRKRFFELQLNATLRLLKQGHIDREHLKGSWAGATGQCQFMPSNFPLYARDFDGDGKKDIWTNKADIFASIAYFLKKVGWEKGKSIGSLALNTLNKKINPKIYLGQDAYNNLGFRSLDGSPLKGTWSARRAAQIPMKNSPVVLRGSNYKPLMAWNRSTLFAAFNILIVDALKI